MNVTREGTGTKKYTIDSGPNKDTWLISHTKHGTSAWEGRGGGGGGLLDAAHVGEVWTTNDIIQAAENSEQKHDRVVVVHKEARGRVLWRLRHCTPRRCPWIYL